MDPAVDMKGITMRFGKVVANDKVDFSVEKGEILALVGENGAGKSTLMNILYGLYIPTDGTPAFYADPKAYGYGQYCTGPGASQRNPLQPWKGQGGGPGTVQAVRHEAGCGQPGGGHFPGNAAEGGNHKGPVPKGGHINPG